MYCSCVCIAIALFPTLVATSAVRRAFPGLNTTLLRLVRENAVNAWFPTILQSWEIGTLAEALTEAEWPRLSVFLPGSVLPPYSLPAGPIHPLGRTHPYHTQNHRSKGQRVAPPRRR